MKTVKFLFIIYLVFGTSSFLFSQEEIDLLILNKKFEEALVKIEQLELQNPTAEIYYKKGLIFNNWQKYPEAIDAFLKAAQISPNNAEILSDLAESLSVIGNNLDAGIYFERAVRLQPDNLSFKAKLGRNYINLKDYKKAYNCFSAIYENDSSNVYWNKQFAFCAFKTEKKEQATSLYEKVLDMNPHDYSSWFNLIRIYDRKKEPEKINSAFESALKYFPEDADLHGERAKYYFEIKNYESAKYNYDKYFIEGGDSVYQSIMNYGISCYFASDENKAISLLEICASQIANDPYVLFYLSLSHKKLNNYEISEQYMNAAIEAATPAYLPDMYHHLGQILGQQRKFPESIKALQKSNELDPTNYEALFEIATTYEEYTTNKTLALNYYRLYLIEAGESARNAEYALSRITKIKEDLFFEE